MKDKKMGILAGIIGIVITLVFLIAFAWILTSIWNWLAPMFWANAPELNILHGLGVMAFIVLIKSLIVKEH